MSTSSSTIAPEYLDPIEKVYLNENWKGCSDIVITCKEIDRITEKLKITEFHADKAFLACHSIVFANMFQTCTESQTEGSTEFVLDEPSKNVLSFMRIIYGSFEDDDSKYDFDHWVSMIEFGHKYCADMVTDKAVLRLCAAFRMIADNVVNTYLSQKYDSATVLKLFLIYRQLVNKEFFISDSTKMDLNRTFDWWQAYCERVCRNYHSQGPPLRLSDFLDMQTVALFKSTDITAFSLVLQDISYENDNILDLVKTHFR